MIQKLRLANPGKTIRSVFDPEFATFGRVLKGFDCTALSAAAKQIPLPETGSSYLATEASLEAVPVARAIGEAAYGTLGFEVGYCWGRSSLLNATEWHFCNEINYAVTPFVLILGHLWDLVDGKIDSSKFEIFFVPEGTLIEVFSTTLHFCPCQAQEEGFGCVVILPERTNLPLEKETPDPLLFRQNKWIVAHEANEGLQARGVVAGISGENTQIFFE